MRLLIGLGALVAPRFGARMFGLEPERHPGLPYTMRLFAVRDAAMGAGLMAAATVALGLGVAARGPES